MAATIAMTAKRSENSPKELGRNDAEERKKENQDRAVQKPGPGPSRTSRIRSKYSLMLSSGATAAKF